MVLAELVLAHEAVISLLGVADPVRRLLAAAGQEGDDLEAALPRPSDAVFGLADLLAEGIEMWVHTVFLLCASRAPSSSKGERKKYMTYLGDIFNVTSDFRSNILMQKIHNDRSSLLC